MNRALAGIALLSLASRGTPAQHVAPTLGPKSAPTLGVHFAGPMVASASFGRRWLVGPLTKRGAANAVLVAIEPGLGGIRAGASYGFMAIEEGADQNSRFSFLVAGLQAGPSVMQTLWRSPGAEPHSTYGGSDVRITFIGTVGAGLYWKVAGHVHENSSPRVLLLTAGFSY